MDGMLQRLTSTIKLGKLHNNHFFITSLLWPGINIAIEYIVCPNGKDIDSYSFVIHVPGEIKFVKVKLIFLQVF